MGYRSEVCITFNPEASEKFFKAIEDIQDTALKSEVVSLLFCGNHTHKVKDGSHCWHWDSIKWYDDVEDAGDYPALAFIRKFIESLANEQYRKLMIGDDLSDAVDEGGFFKENPFEPYIGRKLIIK